jgi:cation channel sperm-associated protein 2
MKGFRDLSEYSSIFRDKLIQEFNIIESLDAITTSTLRYTTRDFIEPLIQKKILTEAPSSVIWFPGIKRIPNVGPSVDKRLLRTKNKQFVPIAAWSRWITKEASFYKPIMLLAIIAHSVNVGIMAEIYQQGYKFHDRFAIHTTIDACLLSIFYWDIVLHLLDDWYGYLFEDQRIYDVFITMIITIPGIVELVNGDISNPLRCLRIFSGLKMPLYIPSLKIVLNTSFQALWSMNYIIMFILMVMVVYAVIGVYLFWGYTHSRIPGLIFYDYWASLSEGFETVFIVMTYDQWDPQLRDYMRVTDPVMTSIFMVSWTLIGGILM